MRSLAPFAWGLGLFLVAPRLAGWLPILELFGGPVGFGCLLAGLAASVARLSGWRTPGVRLAPWAVLLTAAGVYVSVGVYYTSRVAPTGDEPEYLLMAQSLWRDSDLVVADNWEREEWREYTAGMGLPGGPLGRDDRPRPARPPGLPLFLAPVYALGGRSGVTVFLALVAALATLPTLALARLLAGGSGGDGVVALAALGPPLLYYSFHAYPESLSALAVATALWLLLSKTGPVPAGLAALAASLLPWLHTRMAPTAAALGLVALIRLRGRSLAVFLAVAAAMAAGFIGYHWVVFGDPSPLVIYGGKLPRHVREATPLAAAFGLWLDRSFGLLACAPVFLLALAGLPALLRRGRAAIPWLLVAAGILAPLVPWRLWFGGYCPPARFLVPLLPVLVALTALRLGEGSFGLARWRGGLVAAGALLAVVLLADPAQMLLLNVKEQAPFVWRALASEGWAARYLPAFTDRGPEAGRIHGAWVASVIVLIALDRLAARWSAADRLFRTPALPVAGLILIGLAIDHWALE